LGTGFNPTKLSSSLTRPKFFPVFFAIKLGHFIAKTFFPYVTKTHAYQQKSENEEKESLVGKLLD